MEKKNNKRKLVGIVISDKMDKTRVVAVERFVKHRRYEKIYKITKRFKAHDKDNQYKEGDKVIISEIRPLSKDKRWNIISLAEKVIKK